MMSIHVMEERMTSLSKRFLFTLLMMACLSSVWGCGSPPWNQRSSGYTSLLPGRKKATDSFSQLLRSARQAEKQHNDDRAKNILAKLRKDYPDKAEPLHRLGVIADRNRNYKQAEKLLTEALQLDPQNAEILNDLGYCLFLQGKLTKAESVLSNAVTIEANNPRYRNNLGMVYGHLNQYDKAREEFETAGGPADAYYNLAFVYAAQDQTKEAIACFQRTLETNPHHEQAQSALRSFTALEENPNLASYDEFSDDGTLLIPFVENASSTDGAIAQSMPQPTQSAPVRQAAFRQPLSNNRTAGIETRALQDRARSMMHHRMERNKRVAEQ